MIYKKQDLGRVANSKDTKEAGPGGGHLTWPRLSTNYHYFRIFVSSFPLFRHEYNFVRSKTAGGKEMKAFRV